MVLYQDGGAWGREEERGSQQNLFAFKSESRKCLVINLVDCLRGFLSVLETALRAKVLAENEKILRFPAF